MTPDSPLVSVIMIFLNAEKYMEEAVESVFGQTYDHWELLFVDDGSTDASTSIALRYVQQNPEKARYLQHAEHQNRGMSASRNLGVREARGEYIAFLDADDVYLSQKLEKQVALLGLHPSAAMIMGATQHWHSWTGRTEDRERDSLRKLGGPPNTLVQPPRMIAHFLRLIAQTPGTCGVLVRRNAFVQVGGFEEGFRGMYEDQVFFFKLCLKLPIYIESGSWDRYRQHPESHSRVMRKKGHGRKGRLNPSYRTFLLWLERYLIKHRCVDAEVWNAFDEEFKPYRNPLIYHMSVLIYRFIDKKHLVGSFMMRAKHKLFRLC